MALIKLKCYYVIIFLFFAFNSCNNEKKILDINVENKEPINNSTNTKKDTLSNKVIYRGKVIEKKNIRPIGQEKKVINNK